MANLWITGSLRSLLLVELQKICVKLRGCDWHVGPTYLCITRVLHDDCHGEESHSNT